MSRFLRRFQPARTIESLQILRDGFSQEPIRPPVTLDVPLLDVRTQDGRFNNFQIFEGGFGESGLDGDSGFDSGSGSGSGDSGSGSGSGSGGSGSEPDSGSGPDASGPSGESGSGSGDSGSGSGGDSGDTEPDDGVCTRRSVCGEYYGARFCPHGCAPLAGDYVCTTTKTIYDIETGKFRISHLCLCVQDVPCDWCETAILNPSGCAGVHQGCDPPDNPCNSETYPFGCCPFNILCCYDAGVTYFSHMETCCSIA